MSGVSRGGAPGTSITFLLQDIEPSVKVTVPLPWRVHTNKSRDPFVQ